MTLVLESIRQARPSMTMAAHVFTNKLVAAARFLANKGNTARTNARCAVRHNKFMVLDNTTVQTGSFNDTASAADHNAENVIVVRNAPAAADLYSTEWRRLRNEAPRSRPRNGRTAATRATVTRQFSSPRGPDAPSLHIADGTLEVLKWIAMVMMTLDHVNKYLLGTSVPALYALGRLALPIFSFVLAYNLARPEALVNGAHIRVMKRLALYGALATPAFWMLVGWWPLNVLFMLLATTIIIWLKEQGGRRNRWWAALVLVVGGAFVEFWWFGIFYGLASWAYCRRPNPGRGATWALTAAILGVVNGNLGALAALPLLMTAAQVRFTAPRLRWLGYGFYPAHLTAIALVLQAS